MEKLKITFTFFAIVIVCTASLFFISFNTANTIPKNFHTISLAPIYQVTKMDNK